MFCEQRVAADLRQDVNLQHRAERRHFVTRNIQMPELAVGHFRSRWAWMMKAWERRHLRRGRMHVQVTEHPASGDLHSRAEFLTAL